MDRRKISRPTHASRQAISASSMRARARFSRNCHAPRKRGIQYAAASRLYRRRLRVLDHPPARVMTVSWLEALALDRRDGFPVFHGEDDPGAIIQAVAVFFGPVDADLCWHDF